jgi:glyoxylase I family protein
MEFISGNRSCIMLDSGDGACLELFSGGSREEKPDWAELHIALRTADTRAVLERVRASGMTITMEPKDLVLPSEPPLPITVAFFKGPDGELVELFQNR